MRQRLHFLAAVFLQCGHVSESKAAKLHFIKAFNQLLGVIIAHTALPKTTNQNLRRRTRYDYSILPAATMGQGAKAAGTLPVNIYESEYHRHNIYTSQQHNLHASQYSYITTKCTVPCIKSPCKY